MSKVLSKFKNRGQTTTEYTIFLSVAIAAILFFQVHAKWMVWRNLNVVLEDFKNNSELVSKSTSEYSWDRGSNSKTFGKSKTWTIMGKDSGWQTYTRDYRPDSKATTGDSAYDIYEYLPPK